MHASNIAIFYPNLYIGTNYLIFFSWLAIIGVFLPKLCEASQGEKRRGMSEIRSSGIVAPGPVQSGKLTVAPGPVQPVEFTIAPIVAPALPPY